MTNSETGYEICQDIIRAVAKVYQWPDMIPSPLKEATLSQTQREKYAGDYAFGPDEVAFITLEEDRLMVQQLPYPKMPLAPLGNHRFQIIGTEFHIDFNLQSNQQPESLSMSFAPDQIAARMTQQDSWPVQDLILGNADQAVSQYHEIYKTDPNNSIVNSDRLIQMAESILKFNQPEVARTLCMCITELYPENARAWDTLAQAHSKLGETNRAIKAYQECLQRIPTDTSLDDSARNLLNTHTLARLSALERLHP